MDYLSKMVCLKCKERLIDVQNFREQCIQSFQYLSETFHQQNSAGMALIEVTPVVDSENPSDTAVQVYKILDDSLNEIEGQIEGSIDDQLELQVAQTLIEPKQEEFLNQYQRILDVKEEFGIEETKPMTNRIRASNKTHSIASKIDNTSTTFKHCPISTCDRTFQKQERLDAHLREHSGEKPEICEICGKGLCNQRSLKRHIEGHLGVKKYSCQYCEKSFRSSNGLKVHENLHTKKLKYVCDLCGQIFHNRTGLTVCFITIFLQRNFYLDFFCYFILDSPISS